MRDDPTPAGPYIDVDVDTLAEAAKILTELGTSLSTALAGVRNRAVDAWEAIPPSDLNNAFGFCWGRWSQQLENGHEALTRCGTIAEDSAYGFRQADRKHGR